jgi:predicted RNA-binding Zn-ribbon protein involved in translation (DUF1610 family)
MFFGTQLFFGQVSIEAEASMKKTLCPQCGKRSITETGDSDGITKLQCIRCDTVDPLKTDAVKWANSSLRPPE